MYSQSLKNRAYNYLKALHGYNPDKWINGGEMEELALKAGYKASNISRRLRELTDEGKVERRLFRTGKVRTVYYRYKEHQAEDLYLQKLAEKFGGQVL